MSAGIATVRVRLAAVIAVAAVLMGGLLVGAEPAVAIEGGHLNFVKTVSTGEARVGDKVSFTITVTNDGAVNLFGNNQPSFDDSLDGILGPNSSYASYNKDAAASTGIVSYKSNNTLLTWNGDLAKGGIATITYSVTVVAPAVQGEQLINAVADKTPGVFSNCKPEIGTAECGTSTNVIPEPRLTYTKTVDKSSAVPGDKLRYAITVTNTGDPGQDLPAATFTDDLSAVLLHATYGSDAVADRGTLAYAGSALSWTGALKVGDTAKITYTAKVSAAVKSGHRLTNTVLNTTKTAPSNCESKSTDVHCSATTVAVVHVVPPPPPVKHTPVAPPPPPVVYHGDNNVLAATGSSTSGLVTATVLLLVGGATYLMGSSGRRRRRQSD